MERLTLEVLKNRLDKCPSDLTSTGGLALRWGEGEDGTDTYPAAQGNRQHTHRTYHIPTSKNILNNIFKLLRVKIVALLGEKNPNITYIFTHNCVTALILVFTGLGFCIISHALMKSLGFLKAI